MKRFWIGCAGILLAMVGGAAWADPGQVRRALVTALEQNEALQRACLDNLTHQMSVGYRAYDILGVVEGLSPGQARPRLRLRMTQGALKESRSPWDLAIDGRGFFPLSDGRLTRQGEFRLDAEQRLTAADGSVLLGSGAGATRLQEVRLPDNASNIKVSSDGSVTGTRINGDGKEEKLAQLLLVDVRNPAYLVRRGDHLATTPESGPALPQAPGVDGMGVLSQGYLEMGNTNMLEDLETAAALRAYAGLLSGASSGQP